MQGQMELRTNKWDSLCNKRSVPVLLDLEGMVIDDTEKNERGIAEKNSFQAEAGCSCKQNNEQSKDNSSHRLVKIATKAQRSLRGTK